MEDKKEKHIIIVYKLLEDFLIYIKDFHCDQYGKLLVLKTDDEQMKKDYYSETVEGIVDEYVKRKL